MARRFFRTDLDFFVYVALADNLASAIALDVINCFFPTPLFRTLGISFFHLFNQPQRHSLMPIDQAQQFLPSSPIHLPPRRLALVEDSP